MVTIANRPSSGLIRDYGIIRYQVMESLRYACNLDPFSAGFMILTRIQADSVFSGISTFGRLPYFPCLASENERYDIAFMGIVMITGLVGTMY